MLYLSWVVSVYGSARDVKIGGYNWFDSAILAV